MMTGSGPMEIPLFRTDFRQEVPHYPIRMPDIKSSGEYYFETGSGLRYQVMFARKKGSYLEHIVNFSVLSDAYEDEYSITNRGEIYRVIATVMEIIRIYHEYHACSVSYEFSGEFKKGNEGRETSIRTLLYYRKAQAIVHPSWMVTLKGNRVLVHRKKRT
jgi:hypothetical protein